MPATPDRASRLRDRPAYPLTEAARYARVAPATLRSWVVGRPYPTTQGTRHSRPLIRLADGERRLLSFNNLVEAHVLRALRTTHGTPIQAIRKAIGYAERTFGIDPSHVRRARLTFRLAPSPRTRTRSRPCPRTTRLSTACSRSTRRRDSAPSGPTTLR